MTDNGGCSPEFLAAFIHTGSISVRCQCGRTHFLNSRRADWEKGEYEELLRDSEANPDRFIDRTDEPKWGTFNGKTVVIGCPCGYAEAIEDLLWANRFWLMKFYKARAEKEQVDAERMAADAISTHKAVQQS